jgi:hypothetical protein
LRLAEPSRHVHPPTRGILSPLNRGTSTLPSHILQSPLLPISQIIQTHSPTLPLSSILLSKKPHLTHRPQKVVLLNPFLLLSRIAFVKPPLASPAFLAPSKLPSPPGRSTLCSYTGILGTKLSGFSSARLRRAFAVRWRCFLDLAVGG